MNQTVLIADDEPNIRGLLSTILTGHGYRVLAAENGDQVIEALSGEQEFELLLLDLVMPDHEGLELLHQLRIAGYNSERLKIVVMTGFSAGCMLEAARALGADAVLPKPFSLSELLETVDGLLEKKLQPDQLELDTALSRVMSCPEIAPNRLAGIAHRKQSHIPPIDRIVRHASPDELDLYALGKLQTPDLKAFEEHVNHCPFCFEKLLEAFRFAARYDAAVDDR